MWSRAYVEANRLEMERESEVVGINNLTSDPIDEMNNEKLKVKNGAGAVYDISGRRVKGLSSFRGEPRFYIVNGKKSLNIK